MFQEIKRLLYFPIASYFAFFARLVLKRWKPRIILVTGSSGKTTLLNMIEAQLGNIAKYSHHANSSYGIPFDILGIHRESLSFNEWFKLFLLSLIKVFSKIPQEKIYVVEADSDRPGEAKFITKLLRPDIVIWLNVSRTHSMNFEHLVGSNKTLDEAIAQEFGGFIHKTKEMIISSGDSRLINIEVDKSGRKTLKIKVDGSLRHAVTKDGTHFEYKEEKYKFGYLLPEECIYQILATKKLMEILNIEFDYEFKSFHMPPGRSSIFKGIKNITIVDSTYNANLDSMKVVLKLFNKIDVDRKWIVIGDMLEQGSNEVREHEHLADEINKYEFDQIILMGPRVKKYTFEKIKSTNKMIFVNPDEVLKYLLFSLKGDETILFKGVRFLEGVIENLLANKNDSQYLVRREKVWEVRRKKFGL